MLCPVPAPRPDIATLRLCRPATVGVSFLAQVLECVIVLTATGQSAETGLTAFHLLFRETSSHPEACLLRISKGFASGDLVATRGCPMSWVTTRGIDC